MEIRKRRLAALAQTPLDRIRLSLGQPSSLDRGLQLVQGGPLEGGLELLRADVQPLGDVV